MCVPGNLAIETVIIIVISQISVNLVFIFIWPLILVLLRMVQQ